MLFPLTNDAVPMTNESAPKIISLQPQCIRLCGKNKCHHLQCFTGLQARYEHQYMMVNTFSSALGIVLSYGVIFKTHFGYDKAIAENIGFFTA